MEKQHSLKYIELDKENNGNFFSHSESLNRPIDLILFAVMLSRTF